MLGQLTAQLLLLLLLLQNLYSAQIQASSSQRLSFGETQMTKFSSKLPVKSILTAGQSLVKRALSMILLLWQIGIKYTAVCDE